MPDTPPVAETLLRCDNCGESYYGCIVTPAGPDAGVSVHCPACWQAMTRPSSGTSAITLPQLRFQEDDGDPG